MSYSISYSVSKIIMFSDLECDYINPIDLCNKLNQVRDPSTSSEVFTLNCTISLFSSVCATRECGTCIPCSVIPPQWTMDGSLTQCPTRCIQREQVRLAFLFLILLLTNRDVNRILNKTHMYDATEIFRTLSGHKKESFIKLGFYLLSFFYYLYRFAIPFVKYEWARNITDHY